MTTPLRTDVTTAYPDDPNDPAWTSELRARAILEHQQAHDLLHRVLPTVDQTLADHGLLGATYDPALSVNNTTLAAGVVSWAKVRVYQAVTVTNLCLSIGTAPTGGVTSAGAALYNATGQTLLSDTGSQVTAFGTTGIKVLPLLTPQAVTPGEYVVAFWATAGTNQPAVGRASGGPVANIGRTGAGARFGTAQSGVTTAPASLTGMTAASVAWWGGLT
jgi:hypothetical protein